MIPSSINCYQNIESVSDQAGHRVLGMGGSLTKYIMTGNPYDSFCNNEQPQNNECKTNNVSFLKKLSIATLSLAMLLIGGKFIGKKLNIKMPEKLKNFTNNISNAVKNNKFINNIKDFPSKIFHKK